MAASLDLAHLLFGLVGMLLGSLGTIAAMSRYFVTMAHCRVTTENCQRMQGISCAHNKEWETAITMQLSSLSKKNDIQFRMLRAVISHMENLTPEQRERILNEGRDQ
jgi:hypothetical protein